MVKELVQQYHQFQCSRLRESSRLMFEYQTLLEEPQYGENMEIYAGKKNNWVRIFENGRKDDFIYNKIINSDVHLKILVISLNNHGLGSLYVSHNLEFKESLMFV